MASASLKERTEEYQGQSEKVTHFPQIVGLLRRIVDGRTLLSVTIPGVERQYSSMILGLKPDDRILLLDELNSPEGHKQLSEARKLTAHCRCQGVQLSFSCEVEILKRPEGAVYKTGIPAAVTYLQRRAAYRVRMPLATAIPVILPLEDGKVLEGRLYDISTLGIGVAIQNQPSVHKDQNFPNSVIRIRDGKQIKAEIEIRHILTDEHGKPARFGARFVDLTPEQIQAVRQFTTQMEREALRKKMRG
jgi:c-di-GMP-binding flagellar brake protein YcgR